jgi:cellulose synthase/poly-beta-1,6-N-acetylglucosamine synthase-like glycosyltransferase
MEYFFWISLWLVFYAYLGYPLILLFVSKVIRDKKCGERGGCNSAAIYKPRVSLLISVYNEERVIEKKVLNALATDYPPELLEILIVSDGSTDKTNEIVARFADLNVLLIHYEGRIGKTACLNRAVPLASGEIVIFSDANSLYDRTAVHEMVKHFSNCEIGFVTGHTKYQLGGADDVAESIGLYTNIERITKKLESVTGSVVGADGAIFAIRKHLFTPLKEVDINDFVIPLNVVKKGFRGILEERAFCTEYTGKSAGKEFSRQVRITNRTLRALVNNRDILNFRKNGFFAFKVISHKVAKFMVPFFLVSLLASNGALVRDSWGYAGFFACQVLGYALPLFERKLDRVWGLSKLASMAKAFIIANAAIAWGWIKFLMGEMYITWATTR